ncbi:hypothetical protein KTN05_16015 [Paracoccus sp. Z118]|uniref:hypothetical protein n=1 Tax=Paracoccus sp. Z118 TaxID=2851017 RepID=UPI001C2C8906|nr:hypothetical protein [Paracoccus sp. Z118]MBV0893318.1 hypothetical protein [Paracoccus sp. Z118]
MTIDQVQGWAEEVAHLMASRFGGARRGRQPDLATMIKRRGRALPRRQRRAADVLVRAAAHAATPRIARQIEIEPVREAHRQLVEYLRPLGNRRRMADNATNIAASVVFGLLLVAIAVIWIMVRRGDI